MLSFFDFTFSLNSECKSIQTQSGIGKPMIKRLTATLLKPLMQRCKAKAKLFPMKPTDLTVREFFQGYPVANREFPLY
ncbi:MAG: hypothetical protein O2966_01830 [Proteobacteria bacterium]|nr:hypothetical protein [Pseudomonadota bacterium]